MTIIRAYGLRVRSSEEAFAIPKEVRDAWNAYVLAWIKYYKITEDFLLEPISEVPDND